MFPDGLLRQPSRFGAVSTVRILRSLLIHRIRVVQSAITLKSYPITREVAIGRRSWRTGPDQCGSFLECALGGWPSGARWRDWPERWGDNEAVKRRYYGRSGWYPGCACAGSRSGVADDRLHHRSRAPACSRRTQAKSGADALGLGRSRGGLSTKIHAAGDALGNPVRLIGSPGQRNDIDFAHQLVEASKPMPPPIGATTPIISARRSQKPEARSSSRSPRALFRGRRRGGSITASLS